jgi:inhibitor of KinA sporulation pathway (predicted exonuclease)
MKFPIVVWDTEFTSWKGCNEVGWNPEKDEYKEIIQIGAVKIGSNGEIEDTFTSYCKPRYNTQLSSYIKELTGITQNDISNFDDLVDVWNEFERYHRALLSHRIYICILNLLRVYYLCWLATQSAVVLSWHRRILSGEF